MSTSQTNIAAVEFPGRRSIERALDKVTSPDDLLSLSAETVQAMLAHIDAWANLAGKADNWRLAVAAAGHGKLTNDAWSDEDPAAMIDLLLVAHMATTLPCAQAIPSGFKLAVSEARSRVCDGPHQEAVHAALDAVQQRLEAHAQREASNMAVVLRLAAGHFDDMAAMAVRSRAGESGPEPASQHSDWARFCRITAAVPHDCDENAAWLQLAHAACAKAGIRVGHIVDRLSQLCEQLPTQGATQGAPA